MRRRAVLLLVPVLAATLLVAPVVMEAQQATPTAGGTVGVTLELLGSGEPEAAAGNTLSLRRVTFEPGGSLALHSHPGAIVLYVESGALTYSLVEGEAQVQRAAVAGTPGPTETLGPGDETVLNPGDWLFEQAVVHSARNDGGSPTVVLLSALIESGQPFTVFHEEGMATPSM